MGVIDDLKDIITGNGENGNKNTSLLRNIIIVGMVGTLLLLFGNVFVDTGNENQKIPVTSVNKDREILADSDYESRLTNDLEEIIALIKGVGNVKVKIYISRYAEYEYEYNSNKTNKITSETDQNGGERKIAEDNSESELVIVTDSVGNDKPVIRKKTLPDIEGVLIVAQGAEISLIKYEIIKSVSNLLNIPIHKISVLPYERG